MRELVPLHTPNCSYLSPVHCIRGFPRLSVTQSAICHCRAVGMSRFEHKHQNFGTRCNRNRPSAQGTLHGAENTCRSCIPGGKGVDTRRCTTCGRRVVVTAMRVQDMKTQVLDACGGTLRPRTWSCCQPRSESWFTRCDDFSHTLGTGTARCGPRSCSRAMVSNKK
jgi:hypothetical protein